MAEETKYAPKTVKDVDSHEFVKEYAKHLKGKVRRRRANRFAAVLSAGGV